MIRDAGTDADLILPTQQDTVYLYWNNHLVQPSPENPQSACSPKYYIFHAKSGVPRKLTPCSDIFV